MSHHSKHGTLHWLSAPLIGPSAHTVELVFVWAVALIALASQAVLSLAASAGQTKAQVLVAMALAFDLWGGAATLGTRSGGTYWHRPSLQSWRRAAFYGAHVHPFLLAWLWPEFSWVQAATCYGAMLAMATAVTMVAVPLKRPLALVLATAGATVLSAPAPVAWVPLVFFIKLIAAHAVPPATQPAAISAVEGA